jgi:hypothetical protein
MTTNDNIHKGDNNFDKEVLFVIIAVAIPVPICSHFIVHQYGLLMSDDFIADCRKEESVKVLM